MGDKKYMRLATAAQMYDYDVRLLRDRCIRGRIPGASKEGKEWRVPVAAMDAMLEQCVPVRRNKAWKKGEMSLFAKHHV